MRTIPLTNVSLWMPFCSAPPQGTESFHVLRPCVIDNPFHGNSSRRSLSSLPFRRPSALLGFSPFSSIKRSNSEHDLANWGRKSNSDNLAVERSKQHRSFSLPNSINSAIDWALLATISKLDSTSSTSLEDYPVAKRSKKEVRRLVGLEMPLLPTSTSLFSPPSSATSSNFPKLTSRRSWSRQKASSKLPFLILLFPLLIGALHVYFSFVGVQFMKTGNDLVFGSPMAHKLKYTEDVKLDMHEVWARYERTSTKNHRAASQTDAIKLQKKAVTRSRNVRYLKFKHDEDQVVDSTDENDVVAFLQSIQDEVTNGEHGQ